MSSFAIYKRATLLLSSLLAIMLILVSLVLLYKMNGQSVINPQNRAIMEAVTMPSVAIFHQSNYLRFYPYEDIYQEHTNPIEPKLLDIYFAY